MTTTDGVADGATTGAGEREPVPLTILTGFLGAGKTTLLNRILSGGHGLRTAVLVNDFGSVAIDAELVVGIEDNMMTLTNGCVCCEIRDDLLEAVDRLLLEPEPPDYIVLEASGVAEPMGIYVTFADSNLHDRIRLDSVTCVVDADQVFEYIDRAPELLRLIVHQIGSADLVVLNKADLAGPERIAWLREWIDRMMNRVRILEATYCDVPWEVLMSTDSSVARLVDASGDGGADHEDHGERFDRWTFESAEPISLAALREVVRRRLPGEIYRLKGFVLAAEDPDHRYVLQTVGRRSEIRRLDPWGERAPGTKLVAIGSPDSVEQTWLSDALGECVAAVH